MRGRRKDMAGLTCVCKPCPFSPVFLLMFKVKSATLASLTLVQNDRRYSSLDRGAAAPWL